MVVSLGGTIGKISAIATLSEQATFTHTDIFSFAQSVDAHLGFENQAPAILGDTTRKRKKQKMTFA